MTPAFLLQKFKYAIVLSFIIAAIVTPTPDMVHQAALAVPMILLYLIGVGVAFCSARKSDDALPVRLQSTASNLETPVEGPSILQPLAGAAR